MKQRGVFLIGAILMGIYYFLFPRGTGKEMVLVPRATTSLSSYDIQTAAASGKLLSVRSGDTAAYFNDDFEPVARYGADRMAVDDHWLVVSGGAGLDLIDPDGRLRSRLNADAVPVASDGSLYLYEPDIGRLRRVDPSNGAELWSLDLLSPVTVLDSAAGRTFLGLLDGRALILDEDGEILLRYRPGGSRVEAIFGGSLSDDGRRLALISGLDPQRFVLLEERKNGFRPVSHHDTGSDFRRFVPVGFVNNGRRVIYEGINSILAVDSEEYEVRRLEVDGRPIDWADDEVSGSLALLGAGDTGESMRLLSLRDLTLFESDLPVGTTGLLLDGRNLMLVGAEHFAVLEM